MSFFLTADRPTQTREDMQGAAASEGGRILHPSIQPAGTMFLTSSPQDVAPPTHPREKLWLRRSLWEEFLQSGS